MRLLRWRAGASILGIALLLMVLLPNLPRLRPARTALADSAVFVAYNKGNAIQYAEDWVTQRNNSDGCYVGQVATSQGQNPVCLTATQNGGNDAAHFLGCILNAADITLINQKRTCGTVNEGDRIFNNPNPVIFRFNDLVRPNALPDGWSIVANQADVQSGDLVVFSITPSSFCWGGLVTAVTPTNYTFAQHSTGDKYITALFSDKLKCIDPDPNNDGNTDDARLVDATKSFLHINADATPPQDLTLTAGVADYPPQAAPITWFARDTQSGLGGTSASQPLAGRWGGGYLVQAWDGTAWQDLGAPVHLAEVPQGPLTISVDLTAYAGMCEQVRMRLLVRDNVGNEASEENTVSVRQEGDLTRDGKVDQQDLDALVPYLNTPVDSTTARFDLTGDGQISSADRLWLLQRQGNTCDVQLP